MLSHQVEDDQFGGVVTGGEPVVVVEQFQVVGMAVLIVDREQERCAAGIEKRFQSEIVVIIVVSGGLVVQVTGGVSGFLKRAGKRGLSFQDCPEPRLAGEKRFDSTDVVRFAGETTSRKTKSSPRRSRSSSRGLVGSG